jgi:hypothetical protein
MIDFKGHDKSHSLLVYSTHARWRHEKDKVRVDWLPGASVGVTSIQSVMTEPAPAAWDGPESLQRRMDCTPGECFLSDLRP